MKITKRIVDTKRHTTGYIVNNNKKLTRGQLVKEARRGKVKDVVAKRGPDGWYVSSVPNSERKLYDLPTIVR